MMKRVIFKVLHLKISRITFQIFVNILTCALSFVFQKALSFGVSVDDQFFKTGSHKTNARQIIPNSMPLFQRSHLAEAYFILFNMPYYIVSKQPSILANYAHKCLMSYGGIVYSLLLIKNHELQILYERKLVEQNTTNHI